MKLNRLWLGAAVLGGAAILFARRRLPAASVTFNSLDPERDLDDGSQFVDLQGLRVRTRVAGSGPTAIVLLHGFAASVFTWHRVFRQLSELGTVIAFDRPAYGFTTRPVEADWDGHSPYSLKAQADLTIAMLDHFGIDRAILVGHSAGGSVAVLTALRQPDRLQSLILISPAVYSDVPPPPWLRRIFDAALMRHVGPWIARTGARYANPILDRAWHDPSRINAETREGYFAPFRAKDWDRGMWEAARVNHSTGLRDQVGLLRMPVLVMTGDDDRVVPVTETQRLARELPDARLVVVPDCGHIPQEEQPRSFLDAVIPFIRAASEPKP